MSVHAILLVPAEGDPLGLLAEGPCGARPPMAMRGVCPHHGRGPWWDEDFAGEWCATWGGDEHCNWHITRERALVLAWDGTPVAEGLDRADRCFTLTPRAHEDWVIGVLRGAVPWGYAQKATVVLLDEHGKEVKP